MIKLLQVCMLIYFMLVGSSASGKAGVIAAAQGCGAYGTRSCIDCKIYGTEQGHAAKLPHCGIAKGDRPALRDHTIKLAALPSDL